MKTIARITLLALPLLTGSLNIFAADGGTSASAVTEPSDSKAYLDLNVGGSWLTDTKILGSEFSFDLGMRVDGAFGYHINDAWAVEFEAGWIWNAVDTVDGASLPSNVDFTLYQVPLLVNAVYHVPTDAPWKPYIGAGIGGVVSLFAIDAGGADQTGSDFVFAYQLKVGLGYAFTDQCMIDLSYKGFGSLAPEWDFDPGTIESDDPILVHCLLVSFTYRF